jgi:hypothetical protein
VTPTIILLSLVTWIPWGNKDDDIEKNGCISPDFVKSFPNLFGSLQKMKIPQVQSDIDFEVVNSYTTDLSGINNIITVDDKSTWVNDYYKEVIRQINIDNDNITTTKQISCHIYDMTLTSNNDLLQTVCVCYCHIDKYVVVYHPYQR